MHISSPRLSAITLSFVCMLLTALPASAQKTKARTGKEPLFGKELATYTISSNELDGACFYLVSGHGGPDPGAIGKYQGKELHEIGRAHV